MEFRFNNLSKRSSGLLCLVPSVISKSENLDFSEISEMYKKDLPNIDVLDQEIILWKRLWSAKPFDQLPFTLASKRHNYSSSYILEKSKKVI